MKRSSSITLVLMASVSAVAVTSCKKQDPDTQVMGAYYASVDDCVAAKDDNGQPLYAPQQCEDALAKAQSEHAQNAPKFPSLQDCEEQFGPNACGPSPVTQVPGQTVVVQQNTFMPFMTGYMLGSGGFDPVPVYYAPGSWRTGGSRPFYASGGAHYSAASSSRPLGYVAQTTIGGVSRSAVVSPSRATGGMPSSTSITSSFGSRIGGSSSSAPSVSTSSSRGGFGAISAGRGGAGGD